MSQIDNINKKTLFPPGLEPGTFRVLGERDNHYTTETWITLSETKFIILLDSTVLLMRHYWKWLDSYILQHEKDQLKQMEIVELIWTSKIIFELQKLWS